MSRPCNTFKTIQSAFDLIITDMTMPHMTGKELATEILKINPELPIILCTGFSETITEEAAKHIGIQAFILKPIVMSDLAVTMRKVLDGTRLKLLDAHTRPANQPATAL